MKTLLLVFLGGGLGSLLRYAVHRYFIGAEFTTFPYSTFLVNIIGCFLIGFIIFYTERYGAQAIQWRLFLVTGLCGGFTTFSAFSYDSVLLINEQRIFLFLTYTIGSVVLGILATYFGILMGRNI
ncbi:MAG: crcB [Mucilaginibacter sp.]|nr:crcB [Mucilaginibacter sp.]